MRIHLPASKSIAARALAMRWLSGCYCNLAYLPVCDDCDVMQQGLAALDHSRFGNRHLDVDLHANGTALRVLTALAASVPGVDVTLSGTSRLCSRPMAPLVEALRQAGADIRCLGEEGFAPLHIKGRRLGGGDVMIDPSASSQFVTALMLAAPMWKSGGRIQFSESPVSRPYIIMTSAMLSEFGIRCELLPMEIRVPAGRYDMPLRYDIEPDMSAATFFYEAMALGLKGEIDGVGRRYASLDAAMERVRDGVCADSAGMLQGDAASLDILAAALAEGAADVDLSGLPDSVPALAVAMCFRNVRFRFRGIAHLRLKECDRIDAVCRELARLGYILEYDDCGGVLSWSGKMTAPSDDVVIETYSDHRMAMAFAMVALKIGFIRIKSPGEVAKSFSSFWDELRLCGFSCRERNDVMEVAYPGI